MVKINELKVGDLVMAEFEGTLKEGEVVDLDHLAGQACILTIDDQEFWYEAPHIKPIQLDEGQLFKLGFQKQANDDGTVKYTKGAFRVLLQHPSEFSNFEMWYREDRRLIKKPVFVHEFQNNYHEMTKVHLTKQE